VKRLRFVLVLLFGLGLSGVVHATDPAPALRLGSKNFTESVILAELLRLDAAGRGLTLEHRRAMGGSAILWKALLEGSIDVYPEYTGTLRRELLTDLPQQADEAALSEALRQRGIGISAPLGFDDSYALGVNEAMAARLNLRTLSDLHAQPQLRYGLSNEFVSRGDGWPGLAAAYGYAPASLKAMDHSLAYRALAENAVDVIDLYTTDAEIARDQIRVLQDDRQYFPAYQAVFLYRLQAAQEHPPLLDALRDLAGRIPVEAMRDMNAAVLLDHRGETDTAAAFLGVQGQAQVGESGLWQRLWRRSLEHLQLVGISLGAALLIGLPLGVAAARVRRLGQLLLGLAAVLQTIPSLAMFVFLIPLLGIGARPAIAALFLYSLLPIVRNTLTGLDSIAAPLREAAAALGLPYAVRLLRIELPLAARTIVAGIGTAAVIDVGTATLGALIGAGGYGEPILTGIRLGSVPLILEGAVPAALLALAVQALSQLAEHLLTPRGLRLAARE
jgi:osmoprotectant transport system permease protein